MLAKFIARAVVDEILPPSAVQQLFAAAPSPQAEACVNEVGWVQEGWGVVVDGCGDRVWVREWMGRCNYSCCCS